MWFAEGVEFPRIIRVNSCQKLDQGVIVVVKKSASSMNYNLFRCDCIPIFRALNI
jgi:hypothetical protein